ncbi:MAG: hypothetical protein K6E22_04075 [Treponema sp.]|nr:hypothetical protein [Treponema sp.]
MINTKKIILICTAIILIICSKLFSKTQGLVYPSGEGFVTESMSCDSDDNICIEGGAILFIPFFVFCFTIIKKIYIFEFILGNIVLLFQLCLIIAIDGGSIVKTIILGNIPLLGWTISYILLIAELHGFFIYEHKSYRKK